MPEYFKIQIETWRYHDGTAYIEFIDGTLTRQVTHVGERWLSSRRDHDEDVGPLLTDQPLQPGEFDEEDCITVSEFEVAWNRAIAHEDAS
ncbi:hypothetical protein [Streptomyces beihaiensis]|uniref:Uncharacterized protein n=1 Tax=Streptomyces beihaiensis TaxID=2984495 RepID=A0ABT3TZC1_9ACTN|nr:hypothetical protein [Streptomyces beihaiensis]MCX3062403.1 hypothetical protein [Streptomyces beihaiensis]